MNANAITTIARTNDAIRRNATITVNGHVALASRLKRHWQFACAWYSEELKRCVSTLFWTSQSMLSQLRLAQPVRTCAVVVDPRPVPVRVTGGFDLRRTRLPSLAAY